MFDLEKLVMDNVKSHPFTIDCPDCGEKLNVCFNDDGKTIKCPKCNADINIDAKL